MNATLFLIQSLLFRTFSAGTPLLLATVGEIYAERSGILNLGVEGMMAGGAVAGFAVAYTTGNPWLGVGAAILAGMALSLIHSLTTITFKANQVVSGLALTMIGLGLSGLWGKSYVGCPLPAKIPVITIPLLNSIPILGESLGKQDALFYLSALIGIILWFILYHTRWGIIIRSVGENPAAAASFGISVDRVRYLCVMVGGGLSGLAGAYLSLVYIPSWVEGMTGGRGWIVIALTVFSLWNPGRAFLGAYLFGGISGLQYVLQGYGISPNFLMMLPYAATLAVLFIVTRSGSGKRVCPPAAPGVAYQKQK